MLRHGGASLDGLNGVESEKIRQRGQWSSMESVARYKRTGTYLRELHRLTETQMSEAQAASMWLQRNLARFLTRGTGVVRDRGKSTVQRSQSGREDDADDTADARVPPVWKRRKTSRK